MRFAAAAFPFLIPLIVVPHWSFYFDIAPKVALIFVGAAVMLVLVSFEFDSMAAFLGTPRGRWFAIACAASVVVSVLAAALSTNSSLAWNGSNWRRYGAFTQIALIGLALLTAAYAAGKAERRRAIVRAICAAGLITSLYGIAQYFGWDPLLNISAYEVGEGIFKIVRPPSTLGHADYFAGFLLWPLFVGLHEAREETNRWWKVLTGCSAIASIAAVVLSGSRGAILALLSGVCLYAAVRRPSPRIAAATIALAATATVLFYISPAGERLRARVHWISEDRVGGARVLLWRDSLRMAAAKPIAGFGQDNFVAEFPHFQSAELERSYPNFFQESPHNIFLDALTSEGLLGLLALLLVAAAGLKTGASGPKAGLFAGLTATLIAHQFIPFTAPTAFYFYLGVGLLAGSVEIQVSAPWKPTLWKRAAARVLPIAAAVTLLTLAYRLVSADALLAAVNRSLERDDPRVAAEIYRQAVSRPSTVSADLYFSRRFALVALSSGDIRARLYYAQIAAGAASRATRSPEERQNGWYNLAIIAASRQDGSGVEHALRSAIAAGPNWYKPHWALARFLQLHGREADARKEAELALDLNAGKDAEIAGSLRSAQIHSQSKESETNP